MNEREKFEAWFRKATAPANKFGYDKEELFWSWQACAESKQSELDKANARIAQLEEALKQVNDNNNEVLNILNKILSRN